ALRRVLLRIACHAGASGTLPEGPVLPPGAHLGSAGGCNAVLGREKHARPPVLAARPL
ncbi:MAG: hypothetical protein AVDCRST_MAG01-01-3666, partial [uncultured Rubrobacteraceae bacterium]